MDLATAQKSTEGKAKPKAKAYLYHVMPFEQVSRDLIVPDRKYSDLDYSCRPTSGWKKSWDFFRSFSPCGQEEEAAYVTGYQNQWRQASRHQVSIR